MIRLFRPYANFFALVLIALREMRRELATAGSRDSRDWGMIAYVSRWAQAHPDDPIANFVNSTDWSSTFALMDDTHIQEALEGIVAQTTTDLDGDGNLAPKGDVPLITAIVDLLRLPWGSNRLDPATMTALRRAILRPSEVEEFRRASREAFACNVCAHKFAPGEAGTIRRDADNNISIRCLMCAHPQTAICPTCRESAPLTTTGLSALTSTKFVNCNCKNRPKAAADTLRGSVDPGHLDPVVLVEEFRRRAGLPPRESTRMRINAQAPAPTAALRRRGVVEPSTLRDMTTATWVTAPAFAEMPQAVPTDLPSLLNDDEGDD